MALLMVLGITGAQNHVHAPICQCQVYSKDNITSLDTYSVSQIFPNSGTICAALPVSRDLPAMHLNLPLYGTFAVGGSTCWPSMGGSIKH